MTKEQIQKKAYERFCWRQQNDIKGDDKSDWRWAEYELFNEQEQEPYFHYPRKEDGTQ